MDRKGPIYNFLRYLFVVLSTSVENAEKRQMNIEQCAAAFTENFQNYKFQHNFD